MKVAEPQSLERLKGLYAEMAALTNPKCGGCMIPFSCCDTLACQMADERAQEFGIALPTTDHPKYKFLSPTGCTVEPWLRPICAIHVCERHLVTDEKFGARYFELREELEALEWELMAYVRRERKEAAAGQERKTRGPRGDDC